MRSRLRTFIFQVKTSMDEQTQKFYSKIITLICGTCVSLYALSQGYDGYLALVTVVALFGGEKVLEKVLAKE